jgi:PAS domain S-box-containing protein
MLARSISIRKKIITTITWILAISGTITILVVMLNTYQQMDEQKIHDIKELSLEKSNKITIFLNNHQELVKHLSSFTQLVKWTENPDAQNTAAALSFLNDFNVNNQYLALYILDKKGTAIISTDPSLTGNNYSFRPYFKKAISGEGSMSVAIGVTSNAQGFYFAQPIFKDTNEIIGVIAIKLSPEALYKIFENEIRDVNNHIMLTDQFGVILYSDIKERILSSLGPLSEDVINRLKKDRTYSNLNITPLQYTQAQEVLIWPKKEVTVYKFSDKTDNEKEIIAISPVEGYSLFLVNEDSSWQLSLGSFKLAAISSLLILLSTLLVLFFLSTLIAKSLKPVEDLKDMAKNIGDGNLAVENKIKSGDELEELGFFLSKMAKKLNEYYDNLEQKIAERTQELNTKNEYLNKTKIATINILEDVESERNKTVELAKNLEKFKLALDNASDLIVITDASGTVLYGNNGVVQLTGYTLAEALGKKAGVLWGHLMPPEYYDKMWKTIKINKKTFDGEIKNKRKNGEIYDAKITISPVLNDKKEVEFFIGIQRDITHEKMVDAAKTEFVSLASHQLRTPLSSINWYAEMLLAGDGGPLNDEQKNFVEEIYTGNQRMVDLVNSLLNVSRLELGTFAVDPEPTDVIATAQSVLDELKPGIISKELIINFKHDQEIPIIQADPKLIRIVFQNLLSNAIKYTPAQGSVTLKIDKNTKNLLIEVTDTGYGIPKKDQVRIFEKLFRAENVREKDTEGTGLGLYIVKSIVTHAGGKITFKSEENKGTTFYLEIPLSGMKKKKGDKKIE